MDDKLWEQVTGLESKLTQKIEDALANFTIQDDAKWRAYDFIKIIFDAFMLTAKELNCVIMSRVPFPSGAGATLIEEGYDLKGYFIKAKSCSWGPMAGFVCQLPPFNKKGAQRIASNANENGKYYQQYIDTAHPPQEGLQKPEAQQTDELLEQRAASPFVPLKISEKRKKELFDEAYIAGTDTYTFTIGDVKLLYGIAHSNDKSVFMEYLLVEDSGMWALCHGQVFYRESENDGYKLYEIETLPDYLKQAPVELAVTDQTKNNMRGFRQQYELFKSSNSFKFYPICGVQNYWPPYTDKNEKYKNAVTGDHDLFAIWPKIPALVSGDLVRISEMKKPVIQEPVPEVNLFVEVPGRPFTLQSTASKNIFIEFIPGFSEIQPLEHPSFGNVNEAVFLATQTLNSFVTSAKGGNKATPNAVFHSDEGGRPGVTEMELPVAIFLPPSLVQDKNKRALLIDKYEDFLTVIDIIKDSCYISLNFGWLYDLLNKTHDDSGENIRDQLLKIFIIGSDPLDYKHSVFFENLRTRFNIIFSDAHKGKNAHDKMHYVLTGQWPSPAQ